MALLAAALPAPPAAADLGDCDAVFGQGPGGMAVYCDRECPVLHAASGAVSRTPGATIRVSSYCGDHLITAWSATIPLGQIVASCAAHRVGDAGTDWYCVVDAAAVTDDDIWLGKCSIGSLDQGG